MEKITWTQNIVGDWEGSTALGGRVLAQQCKHRTWTIVVIPAHGHWDGTDHYYFGEDPRDFAAERLADATADHVRNMARRTA